jgi:RHS repeat-associated protein
VSYAYDAQGRRKRKTVNGITTLYVTDADNREVLEYDGTSGQVLRWYAYGAGSNDVLNQLDVVAGTRQTLIPDIQGSILASLDSSTATLTKRGYFPYGASASVTGSFAYTGQRIDTETNGLYYARARMYAPGLGRFLQPDPIGYDGGKYLYAYVGNDPLNRIDPVGLSADIAQIPREPGLVEAFNPLELLLLVAEVKAAVGVTGTIVGVIAGKVLGREVQTAGREVAAVAGQEAAVVWGLRPFARGQAIEQALGQNLPGNFPVIDRFENGLATSIKSLDLNAATYQNASTLYRTLTGYIDSVAGFNGRTWAGVSIRSGDIAGRALNLAVPHTGSAVQQSVINQAIRYGASRGVTVNVIPFP